MLEQTDKTLFLFINSLNSPFFDQVMWVISGKTTWIPLYLLIIAIIIIRYRRKAYIIIPLVILAVVASDQLSVHAFKEVFMRLRPCREPSLEGLVHLVNGKCPGKYGFVSSHASNSFTVAIFALLLIKRKLFSVLIIFWAAIVCYSRVYLGVHYPGDVICGAMLGLLVAWGFYLLYRFMDTRWLMNSSILDSKRNRDVSD